MTFGTTHAHRSTSTSTPTRHLSWLTAPFLCLVIAFVVLASTATATPQRHKPKVNDDRKVEVSRAAGALATLSAPSTTSGAEPAYPLNHALDSKIEPKGTLANYNFETAGGPVGTPPANSNLEAAGSTVLTVPKRRLRHRNVRQLDQVRDPNDPDCQRPWLIRRVEDQQRRDHEFGALDPLNRPGVGLRAR